MMRTNPKNLIAIGFILVLFGFVAPLLMVVRIIESSFFLNFLSYGASLTGLFLGFIGAAWYSRLGKR